MPPDLQRRRQLLVLDGEGLVRDDEAPDLLGDGHIRVDPIDRALQPLMEVRRTGNVRVRDKQRDQVWTAVALNHRLGDLRLQR